ncbi:uncharacterized protein MKZ38_004288 [Zalerion maritima]|uniref:MHYT domain-containing protein n=1 Tax=Zalerion maritima TaxID=339359 RepID=A0AAD5RLQ1_9PEZI|nr:uncharacterized protein MKZ38_004288 [Zalerion maritima]
MGNSEEQYEVYLGQVVPFSFSAGIIVMSYLVSLVGAGSTLELINRRTSNKGKYNHMLLVGAAMSMGGVSIWSMHFIGNRAITVLDGAPELQIVYSAGLTAASFFVPIVVLIVAFVAVDGPGEVNWWRIVLSGFLAGCAICGMHYLGNASISNYNCSYVTGNVIGAAAIAVVASTAALALFFVFRASWTSSWWKRLGCANILAGAVSGMHWCAAKGTSYRLSSLQHAQSEMGRNATIAVVICLAAGASIIMAGSAIYSARTRQWYASKSQQIILAAAVFDDKRRILVSPDGFLPSEKITDTFPQKADDDVFDTAHPLFHWMLRASRNWSSVSNLINAMNDHLASVSHSGRRSRSTRLGVELVDSNGELIDNYATVFRELFCVAAASLAARMKENLSDVGVLWDELFTTGAAMRVARPTHNTSDRSFFRSLFPTVKAHELSDLTEKGQVRTQEYGRGSLMLLVRHVDNQRCIDKLEAAGYRFAELPQVMGIITSSMRIRTPNVTNKLLAMSLPAEMMPKLTPGAHVGLFGIRARVNGGGFDVLVNNKAHNLLPSIKFNDNRLAQSQIDFVGQLGSTSVPGLLRRLGETVNSSSNEADFACELRDVVQQLWDLVADPEFEEAVFVPKVMQAPCPPVGDDTQPTTCDLLVFRRIFPIHSHNSCPTAEFVPLQLFKMQQTVYKNSPHHAAFSRLVHREIAPILSLPRPSESSSHETIKGSTSAKETSPSSFKRKLPSSLLRLPNLPGRKSKKNAANCVGSNRMSLASESQTHLKPPPSDCSSSSLNSSRTNQNQATQSTHRAQTSTLGIMVSQEVTVHVHHESAAPKVDRDGNGGQEGRNPVGIASSNTSTGLGGVAAVGMRGASTKVEIGTDDKTWTFVDELLAFCRD